MGINTLHKGDDCDDDDDGKLPIYHVIRFYVKNSKRYLSRDHF